MTMLDTAPARTDAPATLARITLDNAVRDAIGALLVAESDPSLDPDWSTARYRQIFSQLPTEQLQQILDFGRHSDTAGVGYVRNLPVDPELPPTPVDGGPSRLKKTFVSEGVLLGLTGMLGEPVGFTTEKDGQLVHDVIPVSGGETTQTNMGSSTFLNFHNDIVYDEIGRYDVSNPDFLVLHCVRADHDGIAATHYADARDIIRAVDERTAEILRSPQFRLNAPGSYVRNFAAGEDVLSDPVPLISGPEEFPEIASSANGVVPMTTSAQAALDRMREACREVAHEVFLRPGDALLINNRKGVHARSQFQARYDGQDRWLQRSYVRRSQWTIRYRAVAGRRVHN
ncbi:TauD/TfdA family dioxygenase [Streptacidiphilus fuscans]|uniref:TauD/TfdA family dioxygenase n=1 Tax=Streptacidiphilus fuscans TaxID=2789292 RepID=A0A931B3P5_9ACTN|nr:TauD/TfdA family dioxygenase [Streptacidiphilus fuscans]MBF9068082.1 TauD/TfdA family dioxygenase [Streptacidiphilus fuscans]